MAKQKMKYMTAANNGYQPPRGSAGSAAFGEDSHKRNPLPTPMKGSAIRGNMDFYNNADREKVKRLEVDQRNKENLRGQPC